MKTKMLSLIVCLALCLTLGGVYATWVYSQTNDVADQHQHLTLKLTEAQFSGGYGEYHLDFDNLKIEIDPVTDGSHEAALKITGDIILTFEPNKYAPTEVKTGAVETTWNFGTSIDQTTWTYNGQQIFDVDTTPTTITSAEWGSPDENGVFTYVIPASTIAQKIQLANTIVLDTKSDYDTFAGADALGAGKIGIIVSDGVTSGSTATN